MKKLISILLVLFTLLSCIASCNNADAPIDDITESNTQSTEKITTDVVEETDTVEETEAAPVVVNTYDVSNFVIVFKSEVDMKAANKLKEKIKTTTGVDIPIKRVSSAVNEFEIIIGNVERDVSKEYLDSNLIEVITKYGYIALNKKVMLAGKDAITLEKSADYFISKCVNENQEIVIPEKICDLNEIDLATEKLSPAKANENDIRTVSQNIIRMNLKYQAFEYRVGRLQVLYALLNPDIIAMNECDELWFSGFKMGEALEAIGYKMAPVGTPDTECRFAYKVDTIKLLDSGTVVFKDDALGVTSYFGWIFFEHIPTGKKSVQIDVHFTAGNQTARIREATQISNYFKEVEKAGYTCVITGDFNARHTSTEMKTILNNAKSARNECAVKVNMSYSTVNDGGTGGPAKIGNAIDHCFYSKSGITANYFETVIGYYSHISSDHLPLVFDYSID